MFLKVARFPVKWKSYISTDKSHIREISSFVFLKVARFPVKWKFHKSTDESHIRKISSFVSWKSHKLTDKSHIKEISSFVFLKVHGWVSCQMEFNTETHNVTACISKSRSVVFLKVAEFPVKWSFT